MLDSWLFQVIFLLNNKAAGLMSDNNDVIFSKSCDRVNVFIINNVDIDVNYIDVFAFLIT